MKCLRNVLFLVGVIGAASPAWAQQVRLEAIAAGANPITNFHPGATYGRFYQPRWVGDQARFYAGYSDPAQIGGSGGAVFFGVPDSVSAIEYPGPTYSGIDPAQGAASGLEMLSLDGSGSATWLKGAFAGPGIDGFPRWLVHRSPTGVFRVAAGAGMQAPGLPAGVVFGRSADFYPRDVSRGPSIAFTSTLQGPDALSGESSSVWFGTPDGQLQLVARDGDRAAGLEPGESLIGVYLSASNEEGILVFLANVRESDGQFGAPGFWMSNSSGVSELVREGRAVPGVPGAVIGPLFGYSARAWVSVGGSIYLSVPLEPAVPGGDVGWALLMVRAGEIRVLARSGEPAWDLPQNPWNGQSEISTSQNGHGLAVVGWLDGPATSEYSMAIWGGSPESMRLVARSGMHAPGFGADEVFQYFGNACINDAGQVVFHAAIGEAFDLEPTGWAVYLHDPNAGLILLMRTGQTIVVGPGDERTIANDGLVTMFSPGQTLDNRGRSLQVVGTSRYQVLVQASVPELEGVGACCAGATCIALQQINCLNAERRFAGAGLACNVGGEVLHPCCRADFDQSGRVGLEDLFGFLNAWFAASGRADTNGSGDLSVADVFEFVSAWIAGC